MAHGRVRQPWHPAPSLCCWLDPDTPRTRDLTVRQYGATSDRVFGLAYFQFAERGDVQAGHRSMQLLQQAERRGGEQADPDLHTALGLMEQLSGDRQAAMREYQAALRANPADSVAAGDLAILEARAGDAKDAVAGLQLGEPTHDPADTSAGIDLAHA